MGMIAAYYSTANLHSKVSKKTRERLRACGMRLYGKEPKVFCDSTTKKSEQAQYQEMLDDIENNTTVIVPQLSIINKWTGAAFRDVKKILDKDGNVISLSEGEIGLEQGNELLGKPLNVVCYHSKLGGSDEREYETQSKIFELFCKEKTAWNLQKEYHDEPEENKVNQQPQLQQLASESHLYDLVIVSSFSRIDLRTARFMKWKGKIGCPIYSLYEGLLR